MYFKDGEFNLGTPLGRFQFFHRLYNIPFALSDDGDELPTIEEDLSTQKELVENQRYKGFTRRTKRRTRSNTPPSGNSPMEIVNLPTDQMFVNAEYEVLPENKLEEGWAPLDPVRLSLICLYTGPLTSTMLATVDCTLCKGTREQTRHSQDCRAGRVQNTLIPRQHQVTRQPYHPYPLRHPTRCGKAHRHAAGNSFISRAFPAAQNQAPSTCMPVS